MEDRPATLLPVEKHRPGFRPESHEVNTGPPQKTAENRAFLMNFPLQEKSPSLMIDIDQGPHVSTHEALGCVRWECGAGG
jgi:hypothetical protein